MTASIAVAILTWRGEAMTRACLRSLAEGGGWSGPTLVVDNASGTGEGERLAAEFGVAQVTLPENGGVPAGYNAGLSWAAGLGVDHVLLANNDLAFSDPALLERLGAHAGEDVAAIGPLVRTPDSSVASAGGRLRRWTGHVQRTKVAWSSAPYDVDSLDGACILVSVQAACRIGGFAPEFFLYWEESDWCVRARAAGLRLIVDPSVSVTHAGMGAGNLRQTRRYALRNSLLFIRRNLRAAPGFTAAFAWLFGKLPFFVARRLLERANPVGVLRDAAWAVLFHVRDTARHGWRLPPSGPDICP